MPVPDGHGACLHPAWWCPPRGCRLNSALWRPWWESEGPGEEGWTATLRRRAVRGPRGPTRGRGNVLFRSQFGCLGIGMSLRAGVLSERGLWGSRTGVLYLTGLRAGGAQLIGCLVLQEGTGSQSRWRKLRQEAGMSCRSQMPEAESQPWGGPLHG